MTWKESVSQKMERQVSPDVCNLQFWDGELICLYDDPCLLSREGSPCLFIYVEPLGNVKNLQVTDPTVNSLRVRWDPADGDVRQYNVIYVPVAGGASSMVITLIRICLKFVSLVSWLLTSVCLYWSTLQTQVSGLSTNTVLRNLQPETEYRVTVIPIYPDAEGKKQSENGKTSVYLQCQVWIVLR